MDIKIIALIKALLLPPSGLLLLGVIGLSMRQSKMGGILLFISLIGLTALSLPLVVNLLAKSWESVPDLREERIFRYQPRAIVVLGGGIKQSGQKVVLKNASLIRLRHAARLARETGLPVLLSGGGVVEEFAVSEAELMAENLYADYRLDARWLEKESRNTAENAINSYRILHQAHVQRIILVTQAYHMPRALVQFEKQGFSVLPAPTDFISGESELSVFDFIPSVDALKKSYLLAHEWLGFCWYQLRY